MSQPIFADGLEYEGKVTLTLKSNNRVLTSKTYKNSGTAQLFNFLGYCLINPKAAIVEKLIPSKIKLLYNTASPTAENYTKVVARTDFIGRVQTPSISSNSTNAEVKVTYSFEVPRLMIFGEFNQVALYGEGITDDTEFSAYYYLIDDNSASFAPLKPATWSATTVLLIEWELSISNKNMGTNNG